MSRIGADHLRTLLGNWPVEVRHVKRRGDVFSVHAAEGRFALKPISKHRRRARFVCGLMEYITQGGPPLVPSLVKTRLGSLMVTESPTCHWILCEWVHGRVADWEHLSDALRSTDALARFHRAARGYRHKPGERPKAYWGVWPKTLVQRSELMKQHFDLARRRIAEGSGTRFDHLAVKIAPQQLAYASECLEVLSGSQYEALCDRYRSVGQVVHSDPAGRNFVCTEYGTVRIIDLETVRQDIPAADLAKLLRRVLKKHDWDVGVAGTVVSRYQAAHPLEAEMLPLVYVFCVFPTKICRDLRRYYEAGSGWSQRRHLHKLRKHVRAERAKPDALGGLRELLHTPGTPRVISG